ncbi:MAG: hypothetical protein Q7S65_00810 [Nanoarchaeota archaeon]|nr:hypothetical protein [Nanoarchaeota archaeon]
MADLESYGEEQPRQQPRIDSAQLYNSMNTLTTSMQSMLELFKTAATDMKKDDQEQKGMEDHLAPMMEKFNEIIEQNKIIAEGMIALSDLVKERIPAPSNRPQQAPQGQGMPSPFPEPGTAPPSFGMNFGPPGMPPQPSMDFGMPQFGAPGMPPQGLPPLTGQMGLPPLPFGSSPGLPPLGQPEKRRSLWRK